MNNALVSAVKSNESNGSIVMLKKGGIVGGFPV